MDIEFRDMEYMCALAKYRSITKAAQALFITQPALSLYMKNLQQRIGLELFHTHGRGIQLTAEGEAFVREGERLLREREQAVNAINSVGKQGSGVLTLAVPLGRGSHIVPAFIPEFQWQYPQARIRLFEGHSKELVNHVQSGACELVILNKPSFPTTIEYESLGYERLMVVVAADSPWSELVSFGSDGQARIRLEQCTDAPFILHLPFQHTGQVERQVLHNARIKPRIALETKNLEVSYRLAASGYGLTFLSEYHIDRLSTEGRTYHCVLDDPLAMMEIIIGYRRRSELSFLAREFVALVRRGMGQNR